MGATCLLPEPLVSSGMCVCAVKCYSCMCLSVRSPPKRRQARYRPRLRRARPNTVHAAVGGRGQPWPAVAPAVDGRIDGRGQGPERLSTPNPPGDWLPTAGWLAGLVGLLAGCLWRAAGFQGSYAWQARPARISLLAQLEDRCFWSRRDAFRTNISGRPHLSWSGAVGARASPSWSPR